MSTTEVDWSPRVFIEQQARILRDDCLARLRHIRNRKPANRDEWDADITERVRLQLVIDALGKYLQEEEEA